MKSEQNKSEYEHYLIPRGVLIRKDLTPNGKLLFTVIHTICSRYGYCTAKNEQLGNLLNISKTSISLLIKSLYENKKLIKCEYLRKRYIRIIFLHNVDKEFKSITLSRIKTALNHLSRVKDIYNIYRQEYFNDILADDDIDNLEIKAKIWTDKEGVKRGKDVIDYEE